MEFPECKYQRVIEVFGSDPIVRCADLACKHAGKDVSADTCSSCPNRVAGVKLTPKVRDIHTVVDLPVVDVDDNWPPCRHRLSAEILSCCDTEHIKLCNHRDCDMFDREVLPEVCADCKFAEK